MKTSWKEQGTSRESDLRAGIKMEYRSTGLIICFQRRGQSPHAQSGVSSKSSPGIRGRDFYFRVRCVRREGRGRRREGKWREEGYL